MRREDVEEGGRESRERDAIYDVRKIDLGAIIIQVPMISLTHAVTIAAPMTVAIIATTMYIRELLAAPPDDPPAELPPVSPFAYWDCHSSPSP